MTTKDTQHYDAQRWPWLTMADMATLYGVDKAKLAACLRAQQLVEDGEEQPVRLPAHWHEEAARRSALYRAVTGQSDLAGAIAFWRARTKENDSEH